MTLPWRSVFTSRSRRPPSLYSKVQNESGLPSAPSSTTAPHDCATVFAVTASSTSSGPGTRNEAVSPLHAPSPITTVTITSLCMVVSLRRGSPREGSPSTELSRAHRAAGLQLLSDQRGHPHRKSRRQHVAGAPIHREEIRERLAADPGKEPVPEGERRPHPGPDQAAERGAPGRLPVGRERLQQQR